MTKVVITLENAWQTEDTLKHLTQMDQELCLLKNCALVYEMQMLG